MYESFMYDKNGARLVESVKHNNNNKTAIAYKIHKNCTVIIKIKSKNIT